MNNKHIILPDIHGDFRKLMQVMRNLHKKGFRLKNTDNKVVQLGDRVDRGSDSYRVNRFFLKLQKKYPNQVTLLHGNHEGMMKQAAISADNDHLFYYNGGDKTLASYSKYTKEYGRNRLYFSILKAGHWDMFVDPVLYKETDNYFFCHAPIPKFHYRKGIGGLTPDSFLNDENSLTWSYVQGIPTETWVDHDLMNGKLCIYGHIHGIEYNKVNGEYNFPHPKKIGNSILLDSGCGCHHDAKLVALILPDLLVIDNKGSESVLS